MSRINEVLASPQLSLLWICAIAAALVFMALVYSTATFRHGAPATLSKALREIVWSIVPIVIVIAAAAPAIRSAIPSEGTQGLVMELGDDPCLLSKPSPNDAKLMAAHLSCIANYR